MPSFVHELDAVVDVKGFGEVRYDMAFGGNFYAILPIETLGLPFDRARKQEILDAGLAVMDAINAQRRPVHPDNPEIDVCHHVQLVAPGSDARHSRHAMVIHPGWFDRSPCGTGTSARVAQLHARGELPLGQDFVNESFIGTHFVGRAVAETTVGPAAAPPRRRADDHRARLGDRHRPVPPRPGRPVPRGLRAVTLQQVGGPPAIVPESLRAQVADAVRAALVTGRMSPGEVYSAPQLAERFGVSVTPVREALLELVRDGLLVAVRNRGFRVVDPEPGRAGRRRRGPPTARTGRRRAGGPAARRAARRRRRPAAGGRRRVVEAAAAGDVVAHVSADRAFHARLLDLGGNPVLAETVLRLRDRSRMYGGGGEVSRRTLEHAASEHYCCSI